MLVARLHRRDFKTIGSVFLSARQIEAQRIETYRENAHIVDIGNLRKVNRIILSVARLKSRQISRHIAAVGERERRHRVLDSHTASQFHRKPQLVRKAVEIRRLNRDKRKVWRTSARQSEVDCQTASGERSYRRITFHIVTLNFPSLRIRCVFNRHQFRRRALHRNADSARNAILDTRQRRRSVFQSLSHAVGNSHHRYVA